MVHTVQGRSRRHYESGFTWQRHRDKETEAVRRAIQGSQESLRALARRYGVNQKTVAKWKRREHVRDQKTGPKEPRSTVLSLEQEAVIVAFRRHTLLPLDDCLYALQATIHGLRRSSALPLFIAPLPGAPRHQPVARSVRQQAGQGEVPQLPDRLFSRGYRRIAQR